MAWWSCIRAATGSHSEYWTLGRLLQMLSTGSRQQLLAHAEVDRHVDTSLAVAKSAGCTCAMKGWPTSMWIRVSGAVHLSCTCAAAQHIGRSMHDVHERHA